MTHYDARQDTATGRWHYTAEAGVRFEIVGDCAGDGGHETRELACSCYRGWLVGNAKFSTVASAGCTCAVNGCGAVTNSLAVTAHGLAFYLCDEHLNADGLEAVFPAVGAIITG